MPRAVRWPEPYNVARFDKAGNWYINEADYNRLKEFYNSERLQRLYDKRHFKSTGMLPWSDWQDSGAKNISFRGDMQTFKYDPQLVNVADPRGIRGYNSNGCRVSNDRLVYQAQAWSSLDDEVAWGAAWQRCADKWGKEKPASKLIVMEMWKEHHPMKKIAQSINSSEGMVYRHLREGKADLVQAFRDFVNEQ